MGSTHCTVHITPYTIFLTHSTVRSPQYTLHLTPYTLHLTPYTLHLTSYTLHCVLHRDVSSVLRLRQTSVPQLETSTVTCLLPPRAVRCPRLGGAAHCSGGE